MLSSFNIIKNDNVIPQGDRDIVTKFESPVTKEISEKYAKDHIESYENLVKNMLESARAQSQKILTNTYAEVEKLERDTNTKVEEIKKEAYEEGFNEGSKRGYDDAYQSTMEKALLEADKIKKNADDMLALAEKEYKEYLEIKKNDIVNTIIMITEGILQKEVKDKDSISQIVFNAIEKAKNTKRFVIKCNSLYTEEIKNQLEVWKGQLALEADIFVVSDNSVTLGNAIIEKNNGKIIVGIDAGMEKIKNMFKENEF